MTGAPHPRVVKAGRRRVPNGLAHGRPADFARASLSSRSQSQSNERAIERHSNPQPSGTTCGVALSGRRVCVLRARRNVCQNARGGNERRGGAAGERVADSSAARGSRPKISVTTSVRRPRGRRTAKNRASRSLSHTWTYYYT